MTSYPTPRQCALQTFDLHMKLFPFQLDVYTKIIFIPKIHNSITHQLK